MVTRRLYFKKKKGQKTVKIPALQKLDPYDHMCRIVIVMKLDRESLDLK